MAPLRRASQSYNILDPGEEGIPHSCNISAEGAAKKRAARRTGPLLVAPARSVSEAHGARGAYPERRDQAESSKKRRGELERFIAVAWPRRGRSVYRERRGVGEVSR